MSANSDTAVDRRESDVEHSGGNVHPDGGEPVAEQDDEGASVDSDGAEASVDPDAAVARIRARGQAVRDRELETAMARLEATGDLSAAEREAVAELADRLVDSLLAVPERSLREAARRRDEETVRTGLSLFR